MITRDYITIWHYNPNGTYTKNVYPAHVFWEERLAKSGINHSGFFNGSRATVRVPQNANLTVELGDYTRYGKATDSKPDRINDLKVMQIQQNFKGSNPHTRLFLGRASERS